MRTLDERSRPRLKANFRCEVGSAACAFLISEREQRLLRGALYVELLPLLDGRRDIRSICQELRGRTPAEVLYGLDVLSSRGYLADDETDIPANREAYWETLGVEPSAAERAIVSAGVAVQVIGDVNADPCVAALEAAGMHVSATAERVLVVTDDYLNPALEAVNRERLVSGLPWLLARPLGSELWLGPLFEPGQTGCWHCLAERLGAHRKLDAYLQEQQDVNTPFTPPLGEVPATQQLASALIANEVVHWVSGTGVQRLRGTVLTFDTASLEQRTHALVKRPQCPSCGDPGLIAARQREPMRLRSRPKRFVADGGHRSLAPEAALSRLEHHVSGVTGIVSTLRESEFPQSARGLIASFITDHNFVHVNEDLHFFRESLRARSGGKGQTRAQAKVSAICESIERYSGVFRGDEATIQSSAAVLGSQAIHPNDVMLYSPQQFADRERWLAHRTRFTWVPERFDVDREVEWSPIWAISSGELRYLPTASCYFGYDRKWSGETAPFTRADSNGCAAGANLEEALLQGLLELVERDAVAIWWYNRIARPGVELSTFDDPYFARVAEFYRSIGRELHVLDVTNDIEIPTFAAISRRTGGGQEEIIYGFGTHFDARLAASRAVSEMHQSLAFIIDGVPTRQDPAWHADGEAIDWWQTATFQNQRYLEPMGRSKQAPDYEQWRNDDLREDLIRCTQLVERRGLQVFAMEQTRPDAGISVVRVVVPGLRHFWARFAPGRLYDVPVELGWRAHPLAESDINPRPIFL